MNIRIEVLPFVAGTLVVLAVPTVLLWVCRKKRPALVCAGLAGVLVGYLLYFFRDPPRVPPSEPNAILAGADGTVVGIKQLREEKFLGTNVVRVSIYLSLMDVHVNRAPLAGTVTFLGAFPGKRYFTFREESSEYNTHNAIMIENAATRCLVKQIAGPFTREVVYWLERGQTIEGGERIGMMKFGSRLDMYLPADEVSVCVKEGQTVRAGETLVAVLKKENSP